MAKSERSLYCYQDGQRFSVGVPGLWDRSLIHAFLGTYGQLRFPDKVFSVPGVRNWDQSSEIVGLWTKLGVHHIIPAGKINTGSRGCLI